MKFNTKAMLACAAMAISLPAIAKADLLVLNDGRAVDGRIEKVNDREVVFKLADGTADNPARHVERAAVRQIIYCDENGAVTAAPGAVTQPATLPAASRWNVPPEPAAPPVVEPPHGASTYYVIPLHGEVGATVLASALEKSLADAVRRKPTVIVLDIDSPGGLVDESLKIMKVIAHYNKQARIVALTEQDLSAAAIFTLSVKQIYVKPLSTIGAATSFVPGAPNLSAKVEEKMQSAWRAAARNSAEEGGHEPLLADAMIDNDTDLHYETVDGKPVIKEGPGDHVVVRKGKVLTLTSHEAVACGLAAGEADDLADLGKTMGFDGWTECKGLGTALADYLPKQDEAFEDALKKIGADLNMNLTAAVEADPSGNQEFVEVIQQRVVGPTPFYRAPVGPGRPYVPVPPRPGMIRPQNQIIERRIVTRTDPRQWKPRALACVVSLQAVEANLSDAIDACQAFGHEAETAPLKDLRDKISTMRAAMYKERNKYIVPAPSTPAVVNPTANSTPPAPAPGTSTRPRFQPLVPIASDAAVKAPEVADSAEQLKKIESGWQGQTAAPAPLLEKVIGLSATHDGDGTVHISSGGVIASPEYYGPTVTFRVVLMSSDKQVRINCGGSAIFFNSTMHPGELRLYAGPANEHHKPGAGTLPKDQWVGLEFNVTPEEMVIYVDGAERYRYKGDFTKIHQQFAVRADNGDIWVKSIEVIQPK